MDVIQINSNFFNFELKQRIEDVQLVTTPFNDLDGRPFNEKGEREPLTVFDFLVRGEGIVNALKGRVKLFLLRLELNKDYLQPNRNAATWLITQFEKFKQAKAKADQVVKGLREKLSQYDAAGDPVASCEIVQDCASAKKVIDYLTRCSEKIGNDYLTLGTVRRYLPDRIKELQAALDFIPATNNEAAAEAEL